ncbi:metal ABC transporter permease [Nitratiruptor sp. YY09-18]|uniref:metal ABC transporter permease n=1 Tax=Nitratiruptor sp. YY09-18 TaxID=2724901 RepID=UPI00191639AE|nr:iron chelate uptake ABC transporter family permease subunit [Nitratiruptor sp. YY09-18]BCD67484.1 zinc transport system permease protein [Nitratiruptor sp. YY09-18]
MFKFIHLFSNSITASLLLSIAIAIIGSVMLINRYNYLAASIAHGSYGGVGMALYFGISILFGATIFALILALIFAYLTYKSHRHVDVYISILWAVGMSIGIIFNDLTPGYHPDLLAYLFGDILLVPQSDLYYMFFVDVILIIYILMFYHHILAIAYDKEFAKTRGLPVGFLHTLTLILIAFTVVMSIRSIGLILVIALLSIPPFIAQKFTKNFASMIIVSGILGLIVQIVGLFIANTFDISATASIILVAALFFGLSIIKDRK